MKRLLEYTMLRRSKNTIALPHRKDHRRFLNLSVQERYAYNIAKQNAIECLEDVLASRKSHEGYRNALQKINALRVICERGCSPSIAGGFGPFLAFGTPDTSSTPNTTTMGDSEEVDCILETDGSPSSDMPSHIQECFTSDPSPSPWGTAAKLPHSSRQWPTKIQALIEDLQGCAAGTKRYVPMC